MSVNVRVVLLVEDDTTLCTQWLQSYQRKDRFSHYQNLTSLSAFGSILKCEGRTFGFFFSTKREPMSVNVRVVLLVDTTRLCTQWLQSYQRKDRLSHYQNLTSLSAFGSILKDFWGTDVGKCEGRTTTRLCTLVEIRQDYVHVRM
jgi:hypothetical protein